VAFVLVHHGVGEALLDAVTRSIRGGDRQVRFSPIVVIADDCPFETVLRYVHIGVDDVVSLPEKKEVLIQRLGTQLWAEHIYVETADYFGPDRRRLEIDSANDRRMGPSGHARFTIQRLPDIGTRIVRHQIFAAPNFAPKVHLVG
jgi:hypothetical protein